MIVLFTHPLCCQLLPKRTLLTLPRHKQVHKFGGTCVAAAERIEAICKYLVEQGTSGPADAKQARVAHAFCVVLNISAWC